MKKFSFHNFLFLLSLLLCLSACDNHQQKYTDTATSGEITIAVDESYSSIIEAQIETFEALYTKAKINAKYLQEEDAINLFMKDSARIIVLNRELNSEELVKFAQRNLKARTTKIAYDGIAIIVHPSNKDTNITLGNLQNILNASYTNWSQVNPQSNLGNIKIILDNKKSSNGRLLKERFLKGKDFPKNCYAANSNPEVINYVSTHPEAIGIIGGNWISDKDDSLALSFLKKINVVALRDEKGQFNDEYYKPYQAYIKLKQYPLYRTVYIVSREARAGLGSGFTAFVVGDKGQRIILKSGLVPATGPVRIVEINN